MGIAGPGGRAARAKRSFHQGGGIRYLINYADLTFTRSSEASFVDPRNGWLFQASTLAANWLSTNVPRILSDGAILIEGARTNLMTESDNILDGTAWLNAPGGTPGTVTANAAAGPDASALAERIDASGSYFTRYKSGISANETCSAYVRAVSGTTGYAMQTGTTASTGPVGTVGTDWLRISGLTNAAASVFTPYWASMVGASAMDGYFAMAVHEAARFLSSPIRATGGTATRSADVATIAVSASLAAALEGAPWYFYVWPCFSSTDTTGSNPHILDFGTAHLSVYRNGTTGSTIHVFTTVGGAAVILSVAAPAWDAHDKLKITLNVPPSGTWEMTVENVTQGGEASDSAAGRAISLSGKTMSVGAYAGGTSNHLFGTIGRLAAA